jgi:magnesium transporter
MVQDTDTSAKTPSAPAGPQPPSAKPTHLSFTLLDGRLEPAPQGMGNVLIYSDPDADAQKELRGILTVDDHTLASAVDPDEVSRLEHLPGRLFLVWKMPNHASLRTQRMFEVCSLGAFLTSERLVFVVGPDAPGISERRLGKPGTLRELLLALLLDTVHHFLGHLRGIRRITHELQEKLNSSLENKYLLQMFDLGESLIYYANAIDANDAVLTKLKRHGEEVGFNHNEMAVLEDIVIDNQQCFRQAKTYATVLSGLMDARGNIVNNNMNVLLKNLTVVNVIFLPLSVLAGMGGMSEWSVFLESVGIPRWVGWPAFFLGLACIARGTWWLINRWMQRTIGQSNGGPGGSRF